jgi:hypothetical protein
VLHKNQQGSPPLTKAATGSLVWLHHPDLRPSNLLPASPIREQNRAQTVLVTKKILFVSLFVDPNKNQIVLAQGKLLPASPTKEQNRAQTVLVVLVTSKVLFANLFAALNKSLERA